MASPDGAVRLPLNISESRETTTGRFLTTFSGAGVQHMAMATSDIFQTMSRWVPVAHTSCTSRQTTTMTSRPMGPR